jgi:hypothetical protein
MPRFLCAVADFITTDQKDTIPVNRYEGFTETGEVELRVEERISLFECSLAKRGKYSLAFKRCGVLRAPGPAALLSILSYYVRRRCHIGS